jgi:Fe-S-cluster-containing hydrogenase component 2
VGICPGKAMRLDAGRVVVDDSACIRCYCCHELCQYQALEVRKPGVLGCLLGLGGT